MQRPERFKRIGLTLADEVDLQLGVQQRRYHRIHGVLKLHALRMFKRGPAGVGKGVIDHLRAAVIIPDEGAARRIVEYLRKRMPD